MAEMTISSFAKHKGCTVYGVRGGIARGEIELTPWDRIDPDKHRDWKPRPRGRPPNKPQSK